MDRGINSPFVDLKEKLGSGTTQRSKTAKTTTLEQGSVDKTKNKPAKKTEMVKRSPDIILVSIKVNAKWAEKLKEAGIRYKTALRHGVKKQSGHSIFGYEAIGPVSISDIWKKLRVKKNGQPRYVPENAHLETREGGRMDVLIICLKQSGKGKFFALPKPIHELIHSCWKFMKVWINPPIDNVVTHSINLAVRTPNTEPKYILRVHSGLWGTSQPH